MNSFLAFATCAFNVSRCWNLSFERQVALVCAFVRLVLYELNTRLLIGEGCGPYLVSTAALEAALSPFS